MFQSASGMTERYERCGAEAFHPIPRPIIPLKNEVSYRRLL